MSAAPAKLAGFSDRIGSLAAGHEANFVIFDPDAEFTVAPDKLHYRHPISPYLGERLRGVVDATYLRGEPVYRQVNSFLPHAAANSRYARHSIFQFAAPFCRLWPSHLQTRFSRTGTRLSAVSAAREILPCCGSSAWAEGIAAFRPFANPDELFVISDRVWANLAEDDWQEAFDSHPRIGQQHAQAATAESLAMSSHEQSAAMSTEDAQKLALAEGNSQYEQKFGRIFIVCASGKSAAEILAILNARMKPTPADRVARSRRTATSDHAAPSSPLAWSQLNMGISTHILDTALGRPQPKFPSHSRSFATISGLRSPKIKPMQTAAAASFFPKAPRSKAASIAFASKPQPITNRSGCAGLYPYVEIAFEVRDTEQHYHIPLLLTANGYTTYRGS